MAVKIAIQAGHYNKGGGSPEEYTNNKRIADRVSAMCRERGIDVFQTDYYAFNDPIITKTDFSLFLALHCDMNYPDDNGSGFADFPEPSTDGATKESQRICRIINETYFPEVQIKYVSHSNANTRYYYMWKYLTPKTPCVLLEMGQSVDPHDKVLLGNTDLISTGIVKSICKALNIPYEIVPQGNQNPTDYEVEISTLKGQILELKNTITKMINENESKLATKDIECQEKILSYKEKIINFINSL